MTILVKGPNDMGFMISEANGFRAREAVTVTSPSTGLVPGTVLGRITATGKYVLHDNAAADGSQNAAAILGFATPKVAGDSKQTVVLRSAEVDGNKLTFKAGISAPNRAAAIVALAALNIIVR